MSFFDRLHLILKTVIISLLLVVIGLLDFYTGYEIGFSIFYVVPILLASWYVGRNAGYIFSIIGAMIWLLADVYSGHSYSHIIIAYWNSCIRLMFFLVISYSFCRIKSLLEIEQKTARIDFLTGLLNAKGFYENLDRFINKIKRNATPFTLAYMDIDNFKKINDELGHREGDLVLCLISELLKKNFRSTDFIARLGGDEFAFIIDESDLIKVTILFERVKENLLQSVKKKNLPISFSFGVAIFQNLPEKYPSDLVHIADELMYQAKNGGKNQIKYDVISK